MVCAPVRRDNPRALAIFRLYYFAFCVIFIVFPSIWYVRQDKEVDCVLAQQYFEYKKKLFLYMCNNLKFDLSK